MGHSPRFFLLYFLPSRFSLASMTGLELLTFHHTSSAENLKFHQQKTNYILYESRKLEFLKFLSVFRRGCFLANFFSNPSCLGGRWHFECRRGVSYGVAAYGVRAQENH